MKVMADETRDSHTSGDEPRTSTDAGTATDKKKPKHDFPKTQVGKLWDAFGNPEEPVNLHPAAKTDPAGREIRGEVHHLGVKDAFSGLSTKHLSTFYRTHCGRDSLLMGIGAGFGVGGLRAVVGGELMAYFFFFFSVSLLRLRASRTSSYLVGMQLGSWHFRHDSNRVAYFLSAAPKRRASWHEAGR